jgi:site-specific recombinase XerD
MRELPDGLLPTFGRLRRNATSLEHLDDFLKDIKIRGDSETTRVSYRATCSDFLNFIEGLPLASVRPRDIRDYLAWRFQQGASHNTLAQLRYALGAFFKFLERVEAVTISPCRAVPVRKWKRPLPHVLSVAQVEKLIQAARTPRDQAIITVFYSSGCRLSELCGMRIENIQRGERWSVRITGKRDKERIVPLNKRAVDALRPLIAGKTSGYVFPARHRRGGTGSICTLNGKYWFLQWTEKTEVDGETARRQRSRALGRLPEAIRKQATKNGRPLENMTRSEAEEAAAEFMRGQGRNYAPGVERHLTKECVGQMIRQAGLDARIGHVHPHMLRHSFATHLHENGADILTIKELLGHSLIATTEIYTHVSQRTMNETMRKFHPHWR